MKGMKPSQDQNLECVLESAIVLSWADLILEVVMQHQNAFNPLPNLGRLGLLQITTPTEGERTAAAAALNGVSDRASSASPRLC